VTVGTVSVGKVVVVGIGSVGMVTVGISTVVVITGVSTVTLGICPSATAGSGGFEMARATAAKNSLKASSCRTWHSPAQGSRGSSVEDQCAWTDEMPGTRQSDR